MCDSALVHAGPRHAGQELISALAACLVDESSIACEPGEAPAVSVLLQPVSPDEHALRARALRAGQRSRVSLRRGEDNLLPARGDRVVVAIRGVGNEVAQEGTQREAAGVVHAEVVLARIIGAVRARIGNEVHLVATASRAEEVPEPLSSHWPSLLSRGGAFPCSPDRRQRPSSW